MQQSTMTNIIKKTPLWINLILYMVTGAQRLEERVSAKALGGPGPNICIY